MGRPQAMLAVLFSGMAAAASVTELPASAGSGEVVIPTPTISVAPAVPDTVAVAPAVPDTVAVAPAVPDTVAPAVPDTEIDVIVASAPASAATTSTATTFPASITVGSGTLEDPKSLVISGLAAVFLLAAAIVYWFKFYKPYSHPKAPAKSLKQTPAAASKASTVGVQRGMEALADGSELGPRSSLGPNIKDHVAKEPKGLLGKLAFWDNLCAPSKAARARAPMLGEKPAGPSLL